MRTASALLPPQASQYLSCERCGYVGPVEYFSTKVRECLNCAKETARKRAANQRKAELANLAAKQIMASVTRKQVNVPHLCEIAESIAKEFGGVDAFCKSWYYSISCALQSDPGSQRVIRAHEAIAKLIGESTKLRDTSPDVQNLSDEDLETELSSLLTEKILSGKIDLHKFLEMSEGVSETLPSEPEEDLPAPAVLFEAQGDDFPESSVAESET